MTRTEKKRQGVRSVLRLVVLLLSVISCAAASPGIWGTAPVPETLLERTKPEYIPHDPVLVSPDGMGEAAEALAKTVWGEARGCSRTEQAAVVWCVLNRVDNPAWPDSITGVVTQPRQFSGYDEDNPVDEDILALVWDVLARWEAEKICVGHVGRVLPKEYLFFGGDGKTNHFRTEYRGGTTWDWSLDSPY